MVQKNDAKVVHESDNLLVLKANRALNESEFTLLSNLVRKEEEKSGVKIVLVPFSVDVADIPRLSTGGELPGQGNDDEAKAKAEAEQKAKEEAEAKAKAEAEQKVKEESEAKAKDTDKDK